MPANLDFAHAVKIVACRIPEALPVGVGLVTPAFQPVHLDEPVQSWRVAKLGDHLYRLSIGAYPYTGVQDDKVTAFLFPEDEIKWHVTYKAHFDAYTIELAEDHNKRWTVPPGYSTHPHIVVKDIKYDDTDLKYQLFCFESAE